MSMTTERSSASVASRLTPVHSADYAWLTDATTGHNVLDQVASESEVGSHEKGYPGDAPASVCPSCRVSAARLPLDCRSLAAASGTICRCALRKSPLFCHESAEVPLVRALCWVHGQQDEAHRRTQNPIHV